jgi:RimJ/RimL family protein N-acetyltransferase
LIELETPRLRLRAWRAEDREPFAAMNADPVVRRYFPPITRDGSFASLARFEAHFARHGWGFWALEERGTGALIGLCGLQHMSWSAFFTPAVEIGWRLSTPWHGKGLAREAAEAVLHFGFEKLELPRIVAFTVPANAPSWGLMKRLGMRELGEFDHPNLPAGDPLRRRVVYELVNPRRASEMS